MYNFSLYDIPDVGLALFFQMSGQNLASLDMLMLCQVFALHLQTHTVLCKSSSLSPKLLCLPEHDYILSAAGIEHAAFTRLYGRGEKEKKSVRGLIS